MNKKLNKNHFPKSTMNWHSLSEKEVMKTLDTSKNGLSSTEVKFRLNKYGKNEIQQIKKESILKILLAQFNSFFIYILLASVLILLGIDIYNSTSEHILDAGVILAIVFLNAGIGFFQQYRAEKAIQNLKKLILPKSRVLRDGKVVEISSLEIVPGDVILLQSGNKISADARIIHLTISKLMKLPSREKANQSKRLPNH